MKTNDTVLTDTFGVVSITIEQDGKYWWAEGEVLDYGAQGDTSEECKLNFKNGFDATVKQNLKLLGSLEHMVVQMVKGVELRERGE